MTGLDAVTGARAIAAAIVFFWLGMVAAISFLEAPLKFQAPGVSIQVGLGIGRLVFRALNTVEVALAVVLAGAVAFDPRHPGVLAALTVAAAALFTQLVGVRPRLARRSDAVLAAAQAPPGGLVHRSHAHYAYAVLELVKVGALLVAGVALLVLPHYPS